MAAGGLGKAANGDGLAVAANGRLDFPVNGGLWMAADDGRLAFPADGGVERAMDGRLVLGWARTLPRVHEAMAIGPKPEFPGVLVKGEISAG